MPADGDATLDPDRIRSTGFSTAFRGYDQHEVRRYLKRLAEALRAQRSSAPPPGRPASATGTERRATLAEARAAELEATIAGLEATIAGLRRELAERDEQLAGPPQLDDEQAAELLGRETTRVLEAARRAAAELTRTARADAERVRGEAAAEREAAEAERGAALEDLQRRRAEAEDEVERLRAWRADLAHALAAVRDQIDGAIGGLGPDVGGPRPTTGADGGAAPADEPAAPAGQALPRPQAPRLDPEEAAALDALFAKVRADRSRAVADARHVLAGQDGSAAQAPTGEAGGTPDTAGPEGSRTPTRPGEDGPAAVADTDEVLAPLRREALRLLKRAMADAQSELLDLVGRHQGDIGAADVPEPAVQRRRYAEAAAGPVAAAFRAGAAAGGAGRPGAPSDGAGADEVAAELAARLVDPLHERVAAALDGAAAAPEATLERIRGHYREVRAVALGPLVADALDRAYAAGSASGTERADRGSGG